MLAEDAASWFDAGVLADGLLLCGVEACGAGEEVSAVAPASWGRIETGLAR